MEASRTPDETKEFTFVWNGITNKEKGQKWGTEKTSCRKRDYKNSNEECLEIEKPPEIQAASIEEVAPLENCQTELNKLKPLTRFAKEGEVIAYRLAEIFPWGPELSSLRVGKVSRFEPESYKVLLLPVPEYPITVERKLDDEAAPPQRQPDMSLYGEDFSLEINHLSLLDTRILKHADPYAAKTVTHLENEVDVQDQGTETSLRSDKDNEAFATTESVAKNT